LFGKIEHRFEYRIGTVCSCDRSKTERLCVPS
jgi:hypothetical protein